MAGRWMRKVMQTESDSEPAEVHGASRAKQAGKSPAVRSWAEPSVWTERMLRALERGVKGGKWFSLIDKVWRKENLQAAYERVAANKGSAGVDHVTVDAVGKRLEEELTGIEEQLRTGTYRPQALKRTYIEKQGSTEKRPLGIPTVRDRTVHGAVKQVIEPIFEKKFAPNSYGFRPGKGCRDALRTVQRGLDEGCLYIVDVDIKSYFDTINHERLMQRIEEQVADGQLLDLLRAFLKQGIMDGMKYWEPEAGTPQGGVISPLLANIYLNPLDWELLEGGYRSIRYADDMVVVCTTRAEAEAALQLIAAWMRETGLQLHPEKTRVVDMTRQEEYFDFLGYRFKRSRTTGRLFRIPRPKSLKRLRDGIRPLTKRCNGQSLDSTIRQINPRLRGWYGYFKHATPGTFKMVDGWVRMRLRSILRHNCNKPGRGRGIDHTNWTNAFFAEHGLFSCVTAQATACQSARR